MLGLACYVQILLYQSYHSFQLYLYSDAFEGKEMSKSIENPADSPDLLQDTTICLLNPQLLFLASWILRRISKSANLLGTSFWLYSTITGCSKNISYVIIICIHIPSSSNNLAIYLSFAHLGVVGRSTDLAVRERPRPPRTGLKPKTQKQGNFEIHYNLVYT